MHLASADSADGNHRLAQSPRARRHGVRPTLPPPGSTARLALPSQLQPLTGHPDPSAAHPLHELGFDRRPHLLSLIGCSLQHTWLQVGGYRRPRPAQRDWRRASMSESGWRAVAFCATESRGAQREAVVRPWAQAEAADSAALDTQARRSPATSCAPTRARASLPGWPTASCNCSLKTPRSPARSALLSR